MQEDWKIAEKALSFLMEDSWQNLAPDSLGLADRAELVPLLVQYVDAKVKEALPPDEGASLKDKLLEAFLTRLEVMRPYRAAFLKLGDACRRTPALALAMYRAQKGSLKRQLDPMERPLPDIMQTLLIGTYILAFSRWTQETDPTCPQTMALLDKAITRLLKLYET